MAFVLGVYFGLFAVSAIVSLEAAQRLNDAGESWDFKDVLFGCLSLFPIRAFIGMAEEDE